MNKTKRKKLYRLLEKEFRCEIMARLGQFQWPDAGDYFFRAIRYRDKIRKLVFGSSNFVEMGHRWGLPIDPPRREKVHKEKKNSSLFN